MKRKSASPVTVFYSYAHEDEALRLCLQRHLSLLEREGRIQHWYDQLIPPGTERLPAIDQALNKASIILLLISSDFLASHHCYEIEMYSALQRHKCGKARTIPVILRPCDWQEAPFAELECLPRGGKAATEWPDLDDAFSSIAKDIRHTLDIPLQHTLQIFQRFCTYFSLDWLVAKPVQQQPRFTGRLFKMLFAGLIVMLFKRLTAKQTVKRPFLFLTTEYKVPGKKSFYSSCRSFVSSSRPIIRRYL